MQTIVQFPLPRGERVRERVMFDRPINGFSSVAFPLSPALPHEGGGS